MEKSTIVVLFCLLVVCQSLSGQKRNPKYDRMGNVLKVKVYTDTDTILGDIVLNLEDSLIIKNDKYPRLSLFKDDIKYRYQWPENDMYTDTSVQRPFPYTYFFTQSAFPLERAFNHNVNLHNLSGLMLYKSISATLSVLPTSNLPNNRPGIGVTLRTSIPVTSYVHAALGVSSGYVLSLKGFRAVAGGKEEHDVTIFDRMSPFGIVTFGDRKRHLSVATYYTGLLDSKEDQNVHICISGTAPVTEKLSIMGEYILLNASNRRVSGFVAGFRYFQRVYNLNANFHLGLKGNITHKTYYPVVGASFTLWEGSVF